MILLTNDDGINVKGLRELKKQLEKEFDVVVVAPDKENSGVSHSITFKQPIRIYKHSDNEYSISGTPADCVNIALNGLIDKKIDLVISGMNYGANVGKDVIYSGTIAASREAYLQGYPSIAVSLGRIGINDYISEYAEIAVNIIRKIIKNNILDICGLISLNCPEINPNPIPEIKFTKLGSNNYKYKLVKRLDPVGIPYYWIEYDRHNIIDTETDVYAYHNNKISITPLNSDFLNIEAYNILKNKEIDFNKI